MARRTSSESVIPPYPSESRPRPSTTTEPLGSPVRSPTADEGAFEDGGKAAKRKWRHTLGILLLLSTVVLWTASNFLASTIFADNEYSKPFFVTYINTAFFIIPLIPLLVRRTYRDDTSLSSVFSIIRKFSRGRSKSFVSIQADEEGDNLLKPNEDAAHVRESVSPSGQLLLEDELGQSQLLGRIPSSEERLGLVEVAKLSMEFAVLWFLANYFVAACLEYTTVASSTILTSTSSIWTLMVGAFIGVERFSIKKLLGVLSSLAGIILISSVDISGENDKNRGSFPHKSQKEIIIGDSLAFISALLYGIYAVLMKKRIGNEARVNMPLFFGFVGLFNVLLLWPGIVLLHYTGIETFELPPTGRILAIVLVNSASSLVSDYCWAYATLLTSPLVVSVGLSLTIPLSLIGQMLLDSQYSSLVYWVGAGIVFLSFVFINHESKEDD